MSAIPAKAQRQWFCRVIIYFTQNFPRLERRCNTERVWCPHGDSNSSFNLERVASWASRRWGQLHIYAPTTHLIGVIYGGRLPAGKTPTYGSASRKTPISKRADCIIPLRAGQAKALAFRFHALIKQRNQINLFAVDQHARAFHAQVGEQDGSQRGIEHRDKVAGAFRHQCGEIKSSR